MPRQGPSHFEALATGVKEAFRGNKSYVESRVAVGLIGALGLVGGAIGCGSSTDSDSTPTQNGKENVPSHVEPFPPDDTGNVEEINSKQDCLLGADPDEELPSFWVAEGRGVDEYYDDDCHVSDAYLEWYGEKYEEGNLNPESPGDADGLRIYRDCLREAGISGIDLVPDPVISDCTERMINRP